MLEFYELALKADRFAPFEQTLALINADLEGAAYAMQIRLEPNASGEPLADLATVTGPGELGIRTIDVTIDTIAAHMAAGILGGLPPGTNPATGKSYASGDSVTVSRVGIFIPEADITALPQGPEPAIDSTLFYDLHITPEGGAEAVYAGGKFIVRAGVTQ